MNTTLKASVILFALTLSCAVAFEWPFLHSIPHTLFSQKTGTSIEYGLTLDKGELVRSAGNGTVLMTLESDTGNAGFPCTLGNTVIIAHEEGLITIYGNLASLDRIESRSTVETGTIIGETGNTACSPDGSLVFQVVDQVRRLYLNPLLLLPAQPDTRKPSITAATLTGGNGRIHNMSSVRSLRQGKYRLHAEISDTMDGVPNTLSPFRVTILLNGTEHRSLPFELIRSDTGILYLGSTDYRLEQLYNTDNMLNLGEIPLARGRNDISVIARDVTGNERVVSWSITAE